MVVIPWLWGRDMVAFGAKSEDCFTAEQINCVPAALRSIWSLSAGASCAIIVGAVATAMRPVSVSNCREHHPFAVNSTPACYAK